LLAVYMALYWRSWKVCHFWPTR